ncbi:MAG: polysaccharide biosynthesis tyrosine autokinase [Bacteroidales bacterium]|nr:polysaccharide biosynthesis tyrosine autokinase [Bacteroidales bacterium]
MPKKIPLINETFDFRIFLTIIKRSIWIVSLIMIAAIFGAFLYLRYTPPLYKSVSILQISTGDKTNKILEVDGLYEEKNLAQIIELMRSPEFLKRVFNKLPVAIGYYNEGTFLSTELYRNSPFEVKILEGGGLFESKIDVGILDSKNFSLKIDGANIEMENLEFGVPFKIGTMKMQIDVSDYALFNSEENLEKRKFYFIIREPGNIINYHLNKLEIKLLNQQANTIEIAYTDNNAQKTAEVVNTIADEFRKYDVERQRESTESILKFIEEKQDQVYKKLSETERQIHAFKKSNNISPNSDMTMSTFPLYTTKIHEFEKEIMDIEFELVTLDRIRTEIHENHNMNIYELIALLSGAKSEGNIVSILHSLQEKNDRKEELQNDITANHNKIKILEGQITNLKNTLKEFIDNTIKTLKQKTIEYDKKINEYQEEIFNTKGYNEVEYARLTRIYEINEEFLTQLIEKKAQYSISQAGYVSQNIILQRSPIPNSPIFPLKKTVLIVFILLAMLISFMVIIIRYLLYSQIVSINDITSYTDAPIVGTIPKYNKEIPVSQLIVNINTKSIISEAFRTLRTNLEFISHGQENKVVTVSSTVPGEGKTFVAINLAGILAISGKKVILLDLDLRKPRIHKGFDIINDKGISTILINKHGVEDCIKHSKFENLHFVTAGPIPPNPSELIISKEMDSLLEHLKLTYDYIIIDTPPIGIVSDGVSVFRKASFPIYVTRAGYSRRNYINNINHLVDDKQITKLSVVLNGLDSKQTRYGYGYGYGYGSYGNNGAYGYGYFEDAEPERIPIWKRIINKMLFFRKK